MMNSAVVNEEGGRTLNSDKNILERMQIFLGERRYVAEVGGECACSMDVVWSATTAACYCSAASLGQSIISHV